MSKKEMPKPWAVKDGGALRLFDALDAEAFDRFADGQPFQLTPRSRRSNAHNRLYWAALARICDATGRWHSAATLHDELKMALGYVDRSATLAGEVRLIPSSTAFVNMGQADFAEFHKQADALLMEYLSIDTQTVMRPEWSPA